jgi:hypothetical protein
VSYIPPTLRTPVTAYAENAAVATTSETTIVSLVAAANMFLQIMIVTGSATGRFKVKINGTTQLTIRTSAADRTKEIDLDTSGIAVTSGQTITITAFHEETAAQSMECFIGGYTTTGGA